MFYKQDWEDAQQRIIAWWDGAVVDRACLQVTSPRIEAWDAEATSAEEPIDLDERWTNLDYVIASTGDRIRRTFWGGEAFPLFSPNLGPDAFAAFFGGDLTFVDPWTSWVPPIISDWETAPELTIQHDNHWWQLQLELVRRAKAQGNGLWITGIPDTHASGDALAALRGRNELCLDLYDHGPAVHTAMDRMVAAVLQAYEVYFDILQPSMYGSCSGWLPVWWPGRANVIQCDYIALISTEMVEEFFLDSLIAEARCLDRAIFHLDGPDALRHIDLLLEIPEIQAIQWVPGAGALPMTQWLALLTRIQAAGRSLHLSVWPHEVRTLLEELRPEGLMLSTQVGSETEARDLLEKVAAWT
jgi:hypothetical protein